MTPPSTDVVTCFVVRGGRLLVVKRSDRVGTYKGHWSGVSGYLETEDPLEQAWTELREELGATSEDVIYQQKGAPLDVTDTEMGRHWRVHPFRFLARSEFEPRLDWENLELRWVAPDALSQMKTVPGLSEAWRRVAE